MVQFLTDSTSLEYFQFMVENPIDCTETRVHVSYPIFGKDMPPTQAKTVINI